MEFRPTENKDLAKEIFQKRLLEIVAEFNWEVFNDIIDQFKIKSGLKIPTKEEQKKEYERRKQIHDGINEVLKRSNPESVLVSEEEMNEYRLRIPKLEINNSILAIAEADRYKTKFGTVRFNTLTASKALQEVEKKILASGHEIDFNLLDFYILKVFFHELMHLHGGVNNLYKPMNSPYNSINEAITEFLSFTVMIKYSTSVGKSLTKNMKDTYFNSSYGIYENERGVLGLLVEILSQITEVELKVVMNAFYQAYFSDSDVSNNSFIQELPKEIQDSWVNFLSLNYKAEAALNFRENTQKIIDSLGRILN